jgi:hypothetical protein
MLVSYSVNPNVVDKLPDGEGWKSTRGWEHRPGVDLYELVDDISHKGHSINWCNLIGGYRHKDSVIGLSGGIGIDIDNDDGNGQLTLEAAKAHPIYSTATLCYPSSSYGTKGERFRLLWAFPEGIDPSDARRLQVQLMDYTPGIDKSCKSAHNVWYGNQTLDPFWVNVDTPFPLGNHQEIWQEWKDNQPVRANTLTSGGSGLYDPVIHGCFRNYEQEAISLLQKISPRGPAGSGTFPAARDSLIVLLNKFGPSHTKQICERANWRGQWDQDAVIDSLWEWMQDDGAYEGQLGWGTLIHYASQTK